MFNQMKLVCKIPKHCNVFFFFANQKYDQYSYNKLSKIFLEV